jgi:hypothetical protein
MTVLAPGIGGSVGNATVQLARAQGAAKVISTAGSAAKAAHASVRGFKDVIDLSAEGLAEGVRRIRRARARRRIRQADRRAGLSLCGGGRSLASSDRGSAVRQSRAGGLIDTGVFKSGPLRVETGQYRKSRELEFHVPEHRL